MKDPTTGKQMSLAVCLMVWELERARGERNDEQSDMEPLPWMSLCNSLCSLLLKGDLGMR